MIVLMIMDHPENKDITMKEEDLQEKQGIQIEVEDLQGEEDHMVMEDHQMEEDHLMEEDCLMEEDHLMMEDHLMEMEDPHDALIEEDPQDLEALLDQ